VILRARQTAGFTLIEILVVLIIVGLLSALAVFTIGGTSQQRELESEVRKLYVLMQTAAEQAVLNNMELGLQLEEGGYQFVTFHDDTREWNVSEVYIFRHRSFPEWLVTTEFIESDTPKLASAEDKLLPDVVFFSSGETTPFEIEFTAGNNNDSIHVIASDGLSPMEWRQPGNNGDGL
jgi:general secretion pathway protein H